MGAHVPGATGWGCGPVRPAGGSGCSGQEGPGEGGTCPPLGLATAALMRNWMLRPFLNGASDLGRAGTTGTRGTGVNRSQSHGPSLSARCWAEPAPGSSVTLGSRAAWESQVSHPGMTGTAEGRAPAEPTPLSLLGKGASAPVHGWEGKPVTLVLETSPWVCFPYYSKYV